MTFQKGNKHGKRFELSRRKLPKRPTIAKLKKKAWGLLSEYVRRKHADEGGFCSCYTCGFPMHWKLEAQGGHAIPGRTGAVLLDIEIVRPQCNRCNVLMGGRYEIFAAKLIRENGIEWFERKLEGARQVRKWNRIELEQFIEEYKEKIRVMDLMTDAEFVENGCGVPG